MAFKKRETLLFYIIACILCFWVVIKVIFSPFHEKLVALDRKVALQEAKLKKGMRLIEKEEEIYRVYENYDSYFSLQRVSEEEAVAAFQKELLEISDKARLAILDMKPQKDVEGDKFSNEYLINIKADATMEQLVNFLYALQNSSLLFNIEQMDLSPASNASSDLRISMKVVGISFL